MIKTIITTYDGSELKELIFNCVNETLLGLDLGKVKNEEKQRQILTRQETAKFLQISLPTLHSYTKDGLITAFRLGFKIRYRIEDVYKALKQINVNGGKPC